MSLRDDIACVILAGGKGRRMGPARIHKVCLPLLGRPAIVRAIETYKAVGLRRFLVVVGQRAGEVIRTVAAAHPEVCFAYQPAPRGTGDAAAVAVRALAAQGGCGGCLVAMGDKLTRPGAVARVLEAFCRGRADLVLATIARPAAPTAGRIVRGDDGTVLGIVEQADIDRARAARGRIAVGPLRLSAAAVEKRSATVNPSLYCFRFEALRTALGCLTADNAQGEVYLTDAVGVLAAAGARIETVPLPGGDDILGFNTPAELAAAEEALRRRERPPRISQAAGPTLSARTLKPAGRWLAMLDRPGRAVRAALAELYGPEEAFIEERAAAMRRVVRAFVRRHGAARRMVLVRAPGRVNLMGRHVDHRGGPVNVLAIGREVLLAAAGRDDDVVRLENVEARRYPRRAFRLSDLPCGARWADWRDFVDSPAVAGMLAAARGDWGLYARAAAFRLGHECPDVRLRGMDCVAGGNIPPGAGLSSSSALVVAFAEAAVALNGLRVAVGDFVDLCGEGEWFVGSRGGSSDHAAIRAGRLGRVARMGFFPFRIEAEAPWPGGLRVVLAHSGRLAAKSAGARDVFNQRVATYELAEMLLRRLWPAARGMRHLRDITPGRLGVASGELYRALALLPARLTRRGARRLLGGGEAERLERLFSTHRNLGPYDLRGVALFGLAEMARGEAFADALAAGDLDRLGRLLRASHDGDRVVRYGPDGAARRHRVRLDDTTLARLAEANAEPADQPGRYRCSTAEVDCLVDIAGRVEGVVGAQLAGAGLGGCAMVLARAEAVGPLLERLRREYYRPRGVPFEAFACWPVAPAGLVSL